MAPPWQRDARDRSSLMARLQLRIGGMHCAFCARSGMAPAPPTGSIERAYERTEGVEKVLVSLAHEGAGDVSPA